MANRKTIAENNRYWLHDYWLSNSDAMFYIQPGKRGGWGGRAGEWQTETIWCVWTMLAMHIQFLNGRRPLYGNKLAAAGCTSTNSRFNGRSVWQEKKNDVNGKYAIHNAQSQQNQKRFNEVQVVSKLLLFLLTMRWIFYSFLCQRFPTDWAYRFIAVPFLPISCCCWWRLDFQNRALPFFHAFQSIEEDTVNL